ncbi:MULTISPECIES: phage holin family protein [Aequorivita]|uniref:Phage holin family protein n=1 Tax=Aequorivita iocasae TaxID=2803865 RepID=A0ABX7DU00_9FLAO|nr:MULTISPECIES: phage holin family protein [Aequorivita]QQX77625.1 phage holin family protein [Aequorivita iocasae]UCA57122.1 phage holin family protein [Aequorivita sp. F7]
MAFSSLKESLHRVTDRIEDYSVSMAEYYKLRLFKSTMKGAISLVNLLVYGSLSLFVMLFLSVGAAYWLGTFFEHIYVGFLLIGAFYGIILIFMFIFGRKIIERNMLHKFSGLLYDENDLDPKIAAEKELNEYQETLFEEKLPDEKISN